MSGHGSAPVAFVPQITALKPQKLEDVTDDAIWTIVV